MSKVNLSLDSKNDEEIRVMAEDHKTAMAGNANFPDPTPSAADFDGDLALYVASLGEVAGLESILAGKRALKDQRRDKVKANLTARGAHVELESGGNPVEMLTSGFALQAEGTPTSSMPQPANLVATTGDKEGEIDLGCNAVPKAKSYIWQCREHIDGQVPGAWAQAKISGKSSITLTGLVSGRKYAFRVQVLGPNETESPWSDEAVSMAG